MNKYFSKLNGYFCKDLEARNLLNNVYTKTEINNTLSNYYTKTQVDNILNNYYTKTQVNNTLNNYYTKTQVDNTLNNYYTKTQVDNTLNNYYTKTQVDEALNNYYVIEDTITIENGSGSVTINYPNGYNVNNCVPIAMGLKIGDVYSFGYPASSYVLNTRLNATNIRLNATSLIEVTGTYTYNCKIVLMKV